MIQRSLAAAALALCVASPAHALDLRALVSDVAHQFGVPAALANGIAHVETRHNCRVVGSVGEVGLMQLRPSTARGLGYRGPISGLRDCRTGATWAMLYLKRAYVAAHGDWQATATKYNAGVGTRRRSSAYARKVLAAAR